MIAAFVITKKDNPSKGDTRVVNAEDWINENLMVIDAQDPYTNDTWPIEKENWQIAWWLNENFEPPFATD